MSNLTRKLALLVRLVPILTGCVHNGPGPVTPVEAFGHCSSDAVRHTSEGAIGEVTTALASGSYDAALVRLLGKFTAEEIGCAVDLVVDLFTKKAMRTDDTEVQVVLAHAVDWRREHP